ncbi:MAG: DegV family protein [Actinomycetota bacterium]|nr:DegV family protein [Actinomycetota bacterium]MDQ3679975.1 DegV family protein [Actinomycetota bacterium]
MPGLRIVTDSACDLPPAMADRHGIEVVPLTVRFGEEELVDRQDLSPRQFWDRLARSEVLPETAAPSPGAFENAYRKAVHDGGEGVVCITLSSALSATYEAAQLAAQTVSGSVPVRVVDSRAVTMAQGLMAVRAAELAASGAGIDDVVGALEDLVPRSRTFAALDTLENLKKGGRIGGAQAFLGSMLSIKPVIEVTGGKVEPESRQRTRGRALRYLADKVGQHPPAGTLAVMHGDAPDLEEMLDLLAPLHPREQTLVGDIGAVIGTHTGPRVMGVAFFVQ